MDHYFSTMTHTSDSIHLGRFRTKLVGYYIKPKRISYKTILIVQDLNLDIDRTLLGGG